MICTYNNSSLAHHKNKSSTQSGMPANTNRDLTLMRHFSNVLLSIKFNRYKLINQSTSFKNIPHLYYTCFLWHCSNAVGPSILHGSYLIPGLPDANALYPKTLVVSFSHKAQLSFDTLTQPVFLGHYQCPQECLEQTAS